MLIIISAVFAPVAFSGAASDISRSWVRRWIEFTLALVFSKLILVIIFMIGLSVLQGAGQTSSGGNNATNSITNLVIGALTLLLAGFAPWIAIKMVHFAGDAFHAVHAQASTAAAGGQTVVNAPQKVGALARNGSFGSTPSAPAASWSQGSGQPKSPPLTSPGSSVVADTGRASPELAVAGTAAPAVAGRSTAQVVDRTAEGHRPDRSANSGQQRNS
jgi:hypothetical protein